MNRVRLIVTIIVTFVLADALGYFIHHIWLRQDYLPIANLLRPEGEQKVSWIIIANLAFAIGAVWAYAHGVEDKPWLGQGLRFGIVLCLILTLPSFLILYAVLPVPAILMVKQVSSEVIGKLIIGIVIALIYGRTRLSAVLDGSKAP